MSTDLIHRTSTDETTTICGERALPGKSVGVFQPNEVTCPACARAATTTHDPANWMLKDGHTSSTTVYNRSCYICRDPEFAQMGLPLCYPCPVCKAHTPADDVVCDNGHDTYPLEAQMNDGVPTITDVPTGDFL